MIRVLHCVAGLDRGGYEAFIMNVYRNIDRSKIQFDFLYSFDGVYTEEIRKLGGKLYQIPFITQKGPFVYRKAVMDFFKKHPEYKIVHSHMDKFSGMIMECATKNNIPVRIAHSHNTHNDGNILFHIVKNYYGEKIAPYCTCKFACSDDAGKWLFGNTDNVKVVKNGIDVSRFTGTDNRDTSIFTITNIGRFATQKNHSFLIDIFNELYKLDNSSRLVLAGTGTLMEQVKAKVDALGLKEYVTFLGDCNDIPNLLSKTDVICMPSLFEGLPVTLIEAQSAGVPCVISDRIPAEVDVSGDIAFLPLDSPPEQWAKKLLEYKGRQKSDNRQKIIENGYDINATASFLQQFYIDNYRGN